MWRIDEDQLEYASRLLRPCCACRKDLAALFVAAAKRTMVTMSACRRDLEALAVAAAKRTMMVLVMNASESRQMHVCYPTAKALIGYWRRDVQPTLHCACYRCRRQEAW